MREARGYRSPYDYKRTPAMSGPFRRPPPAWKAVLVKAMLGLGFVVLLIAAGAPR